MTENKIEFIKNLESLCRQCRALGDIVIEYGYEDKDGFVPSDTILDDKREMICARWKDQDRRFGVYQSIEGDSNYGILIDAMKAIRKMA